MPVHRSLTGSAIALLALTTSAAHAQQALTAQDYANAERWASYNVSALVDHTLRAPKYLPDGRVFFADPANGSTTYMIADAKKSAPGPAFDQSKLAAALGAAMGSASKTKLAAGKLGISDYEPEANGGFAVTVRAGKFHCDAAIATCTREPEPPAPVVQPSPTATTSQPGVVVPPVARPRPGVGRRGSAPVNISPDGKLAAFVREDNLWVRVIATGVETQLTTDGVKDYGYATDNAGWQHSDAAVLTWSADSKKIATFQQDQRKTGYMYLVPTTFRHPELEAWRYPLVGDADVTMIEPVVIDVRTAALTRLKIAPLQHRSMECDDVSCEGGKWTDAEFSPDGKELAFVSTSRDHKDEDVELADTTTGEVRTVFHDHADTYYGWQSLTDWKPLWEANEILWVSERTGFAQIERYDMKSGKLLGQVTHGDGPVQYILHVDEKKHIIYFMATGKQPGVDPYFDQLYKVDFDGKHQELLTREPLQHVVTASPDGTTFVDIYSSVNTPQTAVLRDDTGKVLVTLAKQDISRLLAKGWKTPTPITVKARDGKTPLYGFLFKPTGFDAASGKKLPVVDYVYPGPQGGSCGSRSFSASHGDDQALADLGFVVVCIDGMGNPERSKAFHDAHASKPEDMGDDTIPDQVAAIKDLAAQLPFVDLTRVGIWGHSGGGNATVSAMFHAPEFFKVGWAESGNHDNRDYEDDWDERWAGLETISPDGKSNYDAQANQNYAANLKGKLMLVHGTMDDNVPPYNTLLVVDALMKANKTFDLLMVPNAHHGYGEQSQYIMRRRWDYFVQNLLGATPPADYQMKSYDQIVRGLYGPGVQE
jgi:dipeptidyl aminopeptidase/acylaminoacyl peptidase